MTTLTQSETSPPGQRADDPTKRFSRAWTRDFAIRHVMVLVMLLVIAYFSYRSAQFGTLGNAQNIAIAAAPFALIAIGETLVILTGGIDLSVGSVIAVSAMIAAKIIAAHPDQLMLAILAAVGVGLIAGSVNGFLVAQIKVPPFIVTLGMLTSASGLAYVVGNGSPIDGLPADFGNIANNKWFGLQIPVWVMIVGIVVMASVMTRTAYGMRVYAVGGNISAAELAGIKTKRVLFSVYAISGMLAGLSGVLLASQVITGAPNLGQGYELDAIAAVVIGGASLIGGRGTIWGTALGLLLIETLNNGLDLLLVSSYWQDVIKGLLIATAVAVDTWAIRRRG